ncbi:MAG: DUF1848 family protein [Candidatus Lokiarchaeota archaeon]|nr:DUF1848 family protein [Candidatus Lokiarchaeota archaeon]
MKHVISASRRTDIPAFYLDWMIDRLKKGYVKVKNPFYPAQVSTVSLKKEEVHSIILWSKDFSKFLNKISEFSEYNLFFHFTINDCQELEPNIPSLNQRLLQMKKLVAEFDPKVIRWRFDPIVFWKENGEIKNNLRSFDKILETMVNLGLKECFFSFATWYDKCKKRAIRNKFEYLVPTKKKRLKITKQLADKCKEKNMVMLACCNDDLIAIKNVEKGHCIDGELLSRLFKEKCSVARYATRETCGCTANKDIGNYNEQICHHSCLYCYANPKI